MFLYLISEVLCNTYQVYMTTSISGDPGATSRNNAPVACADGSWRDLRECFCFGSAAVNASGEAVRGLVKSRRSRIWRLCVSPAHIR